MLQTLKAALDDASLLKKTIAVVSIPLIALLGTLVLTAWYEHEARDAQLRVIRSLEIKASIYEVKSLLTDSETGVRGYMLFKSPDYLQPYNQAKTQLSNSLEKLTTLVANEHQQTVALKDLDNNARIKMDALSKMLEDPVKNGRPNSSNVVASRQSMNAIRSILGEMEKIESRALEQRIRDHNDSLKHTNSLLVLLFALALLSGIAAAYLLSSSVLRRVNRLEEYTRKVSRGQSAQWEDSGNDEIGQLGRSFEVMTRSLLSREEALHQAREELQGANHNLKQLLLETRAANMELESFSYSVSHDLRAPLRHVAGFSELMIRNADNLDAKNLRYLNIISSSIQQMGVLIDELLAFSRMGRASLKTDPVDLNEVVNEVLTDLSPELTTRNIDWKIDLLPVIRGDKVMIRLVFQNLIGNALKYTRTRNQATIEIKSEHLTNPEIERITVSDNGVGFNMAYVDKLFGVFQRLHSSEDYEGTGIGLATVRRIVTRHGGEVSARGEVDKGAEFTISLPTYMKDNDE